MSTGISCRMFTKYVEVVGCDQMGKADLTFLRY